ncbi:MAG: hypothetical protein K8U03_12290 [Planctomycetia bacterium]|nr:hypothetical protein [Planctomycetia bacterium]
MEPYIASQARLIAGVARVDITPPVGMYHRMWGAAIHDRSTGIHRPITATALWLQPRGCGTAGDALLMLALDHCILERAAMDALREAAGHATGIPSAQVHVCLSHTHGAGFMARSRADLPGGDMIGPYLDEMTMRTARCAEQALTAAKPATLVCTAGRSSLAAHRDGFDAGSKQFVCGFHAAGLADDTLVVGRLTLVDNEGKPGRTIGTLVNYACHPTTLAWQNTLVSPDYIGALRETVEGATGAAPCFFIQGASGDLGPREGFVGDVATADRNGRQLGYATLAILEAMPPAGTKFVYTGPVVSGATLGVWKDTPLDPAAATANERWKFQDVLIPIDYRPDLPTIEDTKRDLANWKAAEEKARAAKDDAALREARARAERMTRQLNKLSSLPTGKTFPYTVSIARTGGLLWVVAPGELYQMLQIELRKRFPKFTLIVATISNDWQPGYFPDRPTYGRGIYQEQIAVVAPGSLETVIQQVGDKIAQLTS